MKKLLLAALLVTAAGIAESNAQTRTFRAPAGERGERAQRRTAEPVRPKEIGAFPRAVRGGNPAHLINPMAPRRYYGPPQDTVTTEPYGGRDPYTGNRVTGLILFGIAW